jgi:F-box protein 9
MLSYLDLSELNHTFCVLLTRFFPEGLVLMLTTPDDPLSSLGQLRFRTPKNPTVLSGHYRLHEDHVVLVLRRQDSALKMAVNNRYRGRRREGAQDLGEQTFHLVS